MLPGMAPVIAGGVSNPIRSIFADGTDGFYFDFSRADQTFQNFTGSLADDPGESVALALESHAWGGKSLADLLAGQPNLLANGNFSSWSGGSPVGWSVTNGGDGVLSDASPGARMRSTSTNNRPVLQQAILAVGKLYYVEINVTRVSGSLSFGSPPGQGDTQSISASGTFGVYTVPSSAQLDVRVASTNADFTVNSISAKEVPGSHGRQSTSGARPTRQAGGLVRFDGSDDNLLTTLAPAAAFTIGVKFKVASGGPFVFAGSRTAVSNAIALGINTSGTLQGLAPNQNFGSGGTPGVVTGGSSLYGTVAVGFVTADGANVALYVNGTNVYTGPQSGAINTTVPLMLGAFNNNGSVANALAGDLYNLLAIKKALMPAEIAAITSFWGTS